MNEDLGFTRVRIRKLLLPMLEEFNPKIVETLANTARLIQCRADGETDRHRDHEKGQLEVADKLTLKELKMLEKTDLYRTLREWLVKKRGNLRGLSLKHIEAIERLVLSPKSGKTVELPGEFTVVKTGGNLVFTDLRVEKTSSAN